MPQFRRVTELPSLPLPETLYFVKAVGATRVDFYLTDMQGVAWPIINDESIIQRIGNALDDVFVDNPQIIEVDNLAARNALPHTPYNRLVNVMNATGDNQVQPSNSALYMWDATQQLYSLISQKGTLSLAGITLDGGNF